MKDFVLKFIACYLVLSIMLGSTVITGIAFEAQSEIESNDKFSRIIESFEQNQDLSTAYLIQLLEYTTIRVCEDRIEVEIVQVFHEEYIAFGEKRSPDGDLKYLDFLFDVIFSVLVDELGWDLLTQGNELSGFFVHDCTFFAGEGAVIGCCAHPAPMWRRVFYTEWVYTVREYWCQCCGSHLISRVRTKTQVLRHRYVQYCENCGRNFSKYS